MLHAMFQDQLTFGSEEEFFLRFWPYMGLATILVMLQRPLLEKLYNLFPTSVHIKIGFD